MTCLQASGPCRATVWPSIGVQWINLKGISAFINAYIQWINLKGISAFINAYIFIIQLDIFIYRCIIKLMYIEKNQYIYI